jgi:chemotaxis protein MotA
MADTGSIKGGRAKGGTPKSGGLDLATVLGLIGGFTLVAVAVVLGGSVTAFVDVPSILIVVGGTFAITSISFSWEEVATAQRTIARTIFRHNSDSTRAAHLSLQVAERVRKNGPLEVQGILPRLSDEPFFQKALGVVLDGTPVEEIESMLHNEVSAMTSRHMKSAGVLRRAADVSPAMGLIGTLVGLVQMLGNLDNPDSIGPAMAVALLTTFYGAVLANMLFLPLASKLERNSSEETLNYRIFALTAASIARRENPRRLEMLINTLLPPVKRIAYFD